MSGCCCDQGFKRKEPENGAIDPVCGMKVDACSQDALSITHGGKDYYFCSTACMTQFLNNPTATGKKEHKSFFSFLKKG